MIAPNQFFRLSLACLVCASVLAPMARAQRPQIIDSQADNVDDKTLIDDVDVDRQRRQAIAGQTNEAPAELNELHAKFKKLLTGAKLRGLFTIDGRPMDQLKEDVYEIDKVEKQDEGDYWLITARIKYGEHDRVFPVPLEVKWAGTTPVMTMDNMTIPGMGTFGARIVFHKDKYAGTWQHDAVGGHMFGRIEFASDEKDDE